MCANTFLCKPLQFYWPLADGDFTLLSSITRQLGCLIDKQCSDVLAVICLCLCLCSTTLCIVNISRRRSCQKDIPPEPAKGALMAGIAPDPTPSHPSDPVEHWRLNYQTPGELVIDLGVGQGKILSTCMSRNGGSKLH